MKTIFTLAAAVVALSAVSFTPASAAPVSKLTVGKGTIVEKAAHRVRCHWVKRVVWRHGHRHVTNVRVCR